MLYKINVVDNGLEVAKSLYDSEPALRERLDSAMPLNVMKAHKMIFRASFCEMALEYAITSKYDHIAKQILKIASKEGVAVVTENLISLACQYGCMKFL